jgi:RHS repeat-associated protein
VPGYAQSLGSAHAEATVTVNLTPTERKGEYFRGEVAFDNSSSPVWASLTNTAVLSNVLSSEVLKQFIAQTPETFAYDAEGNLTNDGRWTYVWGADNRLLSMETDTDVPTAAKRKLAFDYDPLGRRIASAVSTWTNSAWLMVASNKFVYDGWNLVAELNATNDTPLRTYAWAGGFDSLLWVNDRTGGQTNSHFVAYDGNANVRALVAAGTGESSAEYEYGPFGDVIRATGPMALKNPIRFSSKYQDPESGLLYYGYRYYSAQHQKWLSRDPIGYEGGLNLYGFVGNDPINGADELGLWRWDGDYIEWGVGGLLGFQGGNVAGGAWSGFNAGYQDAAVRQWGQIRAPFEGVGHLGGMLSTEYGREQYWAMLQKLWPLVQRYGTDDCFRQLVNEHLGDEVLRQLERLQTAEGMGDFLGAVGTEAFVTAGTLGLGKTANASKWIDDLARLANRLDSAVPDVASPIGRSIVSELGYTGLGAARHRTLDIAEHAIQRHGGESVEVDGSLRIEGRHGRRRPKWLAIWAPIPLRFGSPTSVEAPELGGSRPE